MLYRLVCVCLLFTCSCGKALEKLDNRLERLDFSDKVIAVRDIAVDAAHFLADPEAARSALHYYNFLREKAHVPIASLNNEIDTDWLTHFERKFTILASLEYSLKNDCKKALLMLPSQSQEALLEEAAKDLDIKSHLVPVGLTYEGGKAFPRYGTFTKIGIGLDPDLQVRTSILYHELGHVFYKDSEIGLTQEEIEKYVQTDHFKKFNAKVERLVQKGASLLSSLQGTQLGTRLSKMCNEEAMGLIKTQGFLWVGSNDLELEAYQKQEPEEYASTLYERFTEQRADLFSYEKLYENDKLAALFAQFREFSADTNSIVQRGKIVHPSNLERILYGLGYLADKGEDVAKSVTEWESQGECVDAEQLTCKGHCAHVMKHAGTRDALSVYYALSNEDYLAWKKANKKHQNVVSVIDDLKKSLKSLEKPNACIKPLYMYNLIRDLTDEKREYFPEAIDQEWIEKAKNSVFIRNWLYVGLCIGSTAALLMLLAIDSLNRALPKRPVV